MVTEKMESVRSWFQMANGYLRLKERGETAVAFAKERPVAATLIGILAATSFLPAVAFVSFVASFLVIGIVVLLIIEGTAVLSGLVILLFALFGSVVMAAFIGVFILSALVTGRFAWRLSAPLRAKLLARLSAYCAPLTGGKATTEPAPVTELPEEVAPLAESAYAPKASYEDDDFEEEGNEESD